MRILTAALGVAFSLVACEAQASEALTQEIVSYMLKCVGTSNSSSRGQGGNGNYSLQLVDPQGGVLAEINLSELDFSGLRVAISSALAQIAVQEASKALLCLTPLLDEAGVANPVAEQNQDEGGGRGPSFPCSRATTRVEQAICANARLSELDLELSDVFLASLNQRPPYLQSSFRWDQFYWLERRDACENDDAMNACVERQYRARIATLEGAPSPSQSASPSFPCVGRLNAVENAICQNPALARLDIQMSIVFDNALQRLPPSAQYNFRLAQDAWLRRRNTCASAYNIAACVEQAYRARLNAL